MSKDIEDIKFKLNGVSMRYTPSTSICLYGWKKRTLFVLFNNGNLYSYKNVPEEVYMAMRDADSKGRFLAKEVKGNYQYAKEIVKQSVLRRIILYISKSLSNRVTGRVQKSGS